MIAVVKKGKASTSQPSTPQPAAPQPAAPQPANPVPPAQSPAAQPAQPTGDTAMGQLITLTVANIDGDVRTAEVPKPQNLSTKGFGRETLLHLYLFSALSPVRAH